MHFLIQTKSWSSAWNRLSTVSKLNQVISQRVPSVMPTGLFFDADTNTDILELTFAGYNRREVIYVPSVAILGSKEWKEHVRRNNYGRLDVLDEEIRKTLRFLKAAIAANIGVHKGPEGTMFKEGVASSRTGWQGNEFEKFVIGSTLYSYNNGKLQVEPARFMDIKNVGVDERLQPKGTLQGWINAVEQVIVYHRLRFAMYYTIASLFLGPNKSANSVFSIIGDTSIGKTFTLMINASMVGNPDPKSKSLIIPGNTSMAALNAILTSITDIPAFIDEIGEMPEDARNSLTYAIGNGKEAMRGKSDGTLRLDRIIRGNALATGEVAAISEFANNGAAARLFPCNTRPIPKIDGRIVEDIKRALVSNYGHILPLVLTKFFELGIFKMEQFYKAARDRLYITTEDVVMRRKAEYFAMAEVGGILLEKVFKDLGIPSMDPKQIIDEMWLESILGNPDTPLAVKALAALHSWALQNPRNFLVGNKQPLEEHPDTIYGWIVYRKDSRDIEFIDYNTEALGTFLRKSNFGEPRKTLVSSQLKNVV